MLQSGFKFVIRMVKQARSQSNPRRKPPVRRATSPTTAENQAWRDIFSAKFHPATVTKGPPKKSLNVGKKDASYTIASGKRLGGFLVFPSSYAPEVKGWLVWLLGGGCCNGIRPFF